MTLNQHHEKPVAAQVKPMEKRGVIDDATPFLDEQDGLDMTEKTASAALATPRRPA